MITIAPNALSSDAGLLPTAISKSALSRFLNRARTATGLHGNVEVLLTSDAELKRLNRTFRGKNKPTDILSFPSDPIPGLPAAQQHAGDLAISLDTAARQATRHGHPLATELRILLLHGLLHLSGLEHETDSGQMADREATLRAGLRLPSSLIARTAETTLSSTPSPSPEAPVAPGETRRSRATRSSAPFPTRRKILAPKPAPPRKRGRP
ncbi:MAG: hypothetical protein NVSMB3_10330 [Acidobacteriaceae bacterium]